MKGPRRLAVLQKRFGANFPEVVKTLIDASHLRDNIEPEEAAEHSIDFIQAYKLIDGAKLDAYAKVKGKLNAADCDLRIMNISYCCLAGFCR